jgi:hypothetical protein
MKRIVSLLVLGLGAWPALASVPDRATKTRQQPKALVPQQLLGVPMQIPPTIPQVQVDPQLFNAVVKPALELVDVILGRSRVDSEPLGQ